MTQTQTQKKSLRHFLMRLHLLRINYTFSHIYFDISEIPNEFYK